jgi:hypothetical protein
MGIQRHNPLAMNAYVRNNPATPTVDDALNYGYSLIMPLKTSGTVDMNIEEQKFAYKAGLTVEVNLTTGTSPTISSITLKTLRRDADGNVVYSGSMPQTTTLSIPAGIFTINNNTSLTGSGDTSTVTGGLYDKREATTVDLLEVDMNKLREAIHANNATTGDSGSSPALVERHDLCQFPRTHDTPVQRHQRARRASASACATAARGRQPPIPTPRAAERAGCRCAARYHRRHEPCDYAWALQRDGSSSPARPPSRRHRNPGGSQPMRTWSWVRPGATREARSNITGSAPPAVNEVSAAFLTYLRPSDKQRQRLQRGVENFPPS